MKLILLLSLIAFLNPAISNSKELSAYAPTCERIGFKPKTPAYGKCILELSRDDITNNSQQKVEKPVKDNQTESLPAGYARTQRLGSKGSLTLSGSGSSFDDKTSKLDGGGTLIWSKNTNTINSTGGDGNYNAAVAACNAMNVSNALGYSRGWRLPTQQELSGLYNGGIAAAMNAQGWLLFNTWSSADAGDNLHYAIYLYNGYFSRINDMHADLFASCVHESND